MSSNEGNKAALRDAAAMLDEAAATVVAAREQARQARVIASRVYGSVDTPALQEVVAQVHNGSAQASGTAIAYQVAAEHLRAVASRLGT